jgi:ABC-type uncharacterized transport system substrate-binding protein
MRAGASRDTKKLQFFGVVIGIVLLLVCSWSEAEQSGKIPRIGILFIGSRNQPNLEPFKQGLREHGYIEGKNIVIEYRYADGQFDRVPALVDELLRLKVDIIVTTSSISARAARKPTAWLNPAEM